MNSANIIAYDCEGEVYCIDCASEWPAIFHGCGEAGHLFDPGWHVGCTDIGTDGSPCHIEADNGEAYPIFVDGYDFENPYTCFTCQEVID